MKRIEARDVSARPGVLFVNAPPLVLVRFGGEVPDPSFQAFLDEIRRELDGRPLGARCAVFFDVQEIKKTNAARRAQLAEVMKARKEVLARPGTAIAVITRSALTQGIARAVFWIAPAPCPTTIVRDEAEAFAFLATHVDGVDAASGRELYRRLVVEHRAVIG